MDMIITRNSTRFRSLPVYTLTCGKYADCDSAHFHRVALTTTVKEDEDNGSRERWRLQARRCIIEGVPSSKHSRRQMERVPVFLESCP